MRLPRALLMWGVLTVIPAIANSMPQLSLRNMDLKSHFDDYPPAAPITWGYSACWSYIHSDGREYAILGTRDGTAIYNVTDPANAYRVGFIPGPTSIWREAKSYRNWIYVVTEGWGAGEGLQIIRMTDPEHPVLATTYTGNFHRAHTVSIDTTRALLFCNGTRWNAGDFSNYYPSGIHILSLANPEAPVEVGAWPGGPVPPAVPESLYVHDTVPVGNRLYCSSIYASGMRVLDITNPATPVEIAKWTYPGAFTHNSWPDVSGRWLYVTDEVGGEPLKIFDIANLSQPLLVNGYTPNPQAIVHNAHVKGNELYLSSYTEGIRVLDISDPVHPAEYGWADSYPGCSGGFNGVWELCPYFPSGTVIASDMNSGLYVYRPVRNYGRLRARVVDGTSGQPIAGIPVYLDTPAESLTTTADGVVVFAPDPGSHSLLVRKFGYSDATATRSVTLGAVDSVTLTLTLKSTGSYGGTVKSSVGQVALEGSEIDLTGSSRQALTDVSGGFSLSSVPGDLYHIAVRRPGYVTALFDRQLGNGNKQDNVKLVPARSWDDLETDRGWIVGAIGDDAVAGGWVRVDPSASAASIASRKRAGGHGLSSIGTSCSMAMPAKFSASSDSSFGSSCSCGSVCVCGGACGGALRVVASPTPIRPSADRSPSPGSMCFVTGQSSDPSDPNNGDIDGGRTTLRSPYLDASGLTNPMISYWRWFYSNLNECYDWLAVSISNDDGATWVPVDTTRGHHNAWEERTLRVADYVTPTNHLRLRFEAADYGNETAVVAAIDDISVFDGTSQSVAVPGTSVARLAFHGPWPNPARGTVQLGLSVPDRAALEVEIMDLHGRHIATLFRGIAASESLSLVWDGRDAHGRRAPAGVYFARARSHDDQAIVRFVTMP